MVQATHELSRLLDRLEDIAEPQGMRQPPYLFCCPCRLQGILFSMDAATLCSCDWCPDVRCYLSRCNRTCLHQHLPRSSPA